MKIEEILKDIDYLEFLGDDQIDIQGIVRIHESMAEATVISWCSDKNLDKLLVRTAGTVICSPLAKDEDIPAGLNLIIVKQPRKTFRQLLLIYQKLEEARNYGIAKSAIIHDSVKLGKEVSIGENVVIEEDCQIGDHTRIGHNNVILRRTQIDMRVTIGQNNTIGSVGFGYERNEEGEYEVIPHLGNVHIMDNVEIGNNTCIDRAVIGSTLIKTNAKIDNLVHISHGVTIGENSLLIANAMVAGSVVIGSSVWVAPSSSILNGISIEDNATIGMGAVVLKPVTERQIVVGNPAKPLNKR